MDIRDHTLMGEAQELLEDLGTEVPVPFTLMDRLMLVRAKLRDRMVGSPAEEGSGREFAPPVPTAKAEPTVHYPKYIVLCEDDGTLVVYERHEDGEYIPSGMDVPKEEIYRVVELLNLGNER